jgi:tetratricopeptide (TPR) repeat protein
MKRLITGFLSIILFSQLLLCEVRDTGCDASNSRKTDYFFLEAIKLKNSGKHTDAFQSLLHCLEIDPESAAAHYEISNYYLFLKQANLVVEHLEQAVRYSHDNFDYNIALANVFRELGMNDEAIDVYEELVLKHPEKPELNYYLSDIYVRKGEVKKAVQALNRVEENLGMSENVSVQKYRLYASIEQQKEANEEIRKLVAEYPMEAKYPIIMGDLYLEQNNPEKAYEYYRKAYLIDPQNPYYIVSMANYYEYVQDTEAAKNQIHSALRDPLLDIETKLSILVRYISMLQRSKKEMEGVDALFKTLLEQHSQEADLNLMYGNYLLSEKRIEEATFQYQLVVEMSPNNEVAWRQLLGLYLREEKPDDCLRISRAAQVHFPENPEFYFYEGVSLIHKKDYQEALSVFKKGIVYVTQENRQLFSDFYGEIGGLYFQLQEYKQSFDAYEKALQYNEKNVSVLNNYAYFLALTQQDLSKAERMSAQTVQLYPENTTYIDTYAWIFFLQGNYTLAKFYIESAISKSGDQHAEIVDHYGDILYHTGDKEKALEQWEKALKLGKNTKTVRKKIIEKTYYEESVDE